MLRNRVITAATSMILVLITALGMAAQGHTPERGTADSSWGNVLTRQITTISAWGGTLHIQATPADSPWD